MAKKKSARKKTARKKPIPRPHSSIVVDGPDRAPSRAMLHAVGFSRKDFDKPQIGIGVPLVEGNLCNVHAYELGSAIIFSLQDVCAR